MNQDFNFLMYRTADEDVSVNAVIKDETIWLTQKAMAKLFSVDKSSVSRHLKNIFAEGELDETVVVQKLQQPLSMVQCKGKRRQKIHGFITWMRSFPLATGSTPSGPPTSEFGPPAF